LTKFFNKKILKEEADIWSTL